MTPVRIGLMRHLEVGMAMPTGWLTAADLTFWRERYDTMDVIDSPVDAGGIEWARVVSSDLPRALDTARKVHDGEIEATPLLREPMVTEFRTGGLRLPESAWRWILRAAWLTSHSSQRSARDDFLSRIDQAFHTYVENASADTLLVSHAGVMMFMRRMLVRAGFAGPPFRMAEHGRLYVFTRD